MNVLTCKSSRALAIVLPAVMLTAACGSGSDSGAASGGAAKPYVVRGLVDLTGVLGTTFSPANNGAQAYFRMLNESGGVAGHQIDYKAIDGTSTADGGFAAVQQAISAKPVAVLQLTGSSTFLRVQPALTSATIPLLTVVSTDSYVYPPRPYLYQTIMTTKQQAQAVVAKTIEVIGGSLSGKQVAMVGDVTPVVDAVTKNVEQLVEAAGGHMGKAQTVAIGTPSFTSQASTIVSSHPDAVISLATGNDTVTMGTALTTAGLSAPIVSWNAGSSPAVFQKIASAKYYADTEVVYPSTDPTYSDVAKKYGASDSDLSSQWFSIGWVQAALIAGGLSHCTNTCTSTTLNTALEQLNNFQVPNGAAFGPATFSSTSHAAMTSAQFYTWNASTKAIVKSGNPVNLGASAG